MTDIAKMFLVLGIAFFGIGLVVLLASRCHWVGRLPGDILIKKENFTFYFPLATSIVLSIVLSLVMMFFRRH